VTRWIHAQFGVSLRRACRLGGISRAAADIPSADKTALQSDEATRGDRGFTDHEALSRTGFIHMNGRVYDPRIGRFTSADPIMQRPFDSSSYNRYAYVGNNPLSAVDPSGFEVSFPNYPAVFGFPLGIWSLAGEPCGYPSPELIAWSKNPVGNPPGPVPAPQPSNPVGSPPVTPPTQVLGVPKGADVNASVSFNEDYDAYLKNLIDRGIDPYNRKISKRNARLISSVLKNPFFRWIAWDIYDHDVQIQDETQGIQVYVKDGDTIVLMPYIGNKPEHCEALSCMTPPDPDPSIGRLLFEFHVHPINARGRPVPSEADLERSLSVGPGVIWQNTGAPTPTEIPYEAHPL